MHLSKRSNALGFVGADGSVTPMWPSIGDHVRERWPGEVASVWLLYAGGGEHGTHAGCKARSCTVPSHPDAVENALGALGRRFAVPTKDAAERIAELGRPHRFIQNGDLGFGTITDQADVLVFEKIVSAPRLDAEASARLP